MLHPEEPSAARWRVMAISDLVAGARFVGIDGRSSSGKTSLAARIGAAVDGAVVVHTDDIAWHQAVFDWVDLLVDGVLEPARRGQTVAYRPPAWDRLDRPGAVEVAAGAPLVIVEGVGAARRELLGRYDLTLWVQSPRQVIDDRNARRLRAGEMPEQAYEQWMAEELPFIEAERPWERTDLVAAGTPVIPHDPAREVVVSGVLRRRGGR